MLTVTTVRLSGLMIALSSLASAFYWGIDTTRGVHLCFLLKLVGSEQRIMSAIAK